MQKLQSRQHNCPKAITACPQAEVFRKCGRAESHVACTAMYRKVCDIIIRWFEQNAEIAPYEERSASPQTSPSEEKQRQDEIVKSTYLFEIRRICLPASPSYDFLQQRVHQ